MLSIGNVTFNSPLVLAPMAGISDLPYRLINRSFGCGLAFTEMISAAALAHNSKNTLKKVSTSPDDSPLGIQLLGADPDLIRKSIDNIAGYPFDMIDLNAACPVKKVASRGKGAGLLRDPVRLHRLLKQIVEYTHLPVTVKIRSGWDETSLNAVEISLRAEDAGVSAIFIHGRSRNQRYSGTVDYGIIRQVKESVQIPVIASGDALTPALIHKMFDETGCDGVSVARGALGNPWIFRDTDGYLKNGELSSETGIHEKARVMKKHLDANVAFHGEKLGVIQFRKFYSWYTRGMPVRGLKVNAFMADTRDEMAQLIDALEKQIDEGLDTESVYQYVS